MLTVERLAALLREWSEDSDELQAGEEQLYTDEEWAAALATWLAPRLIVGPGAPAAARLTPTDAMIDAGMAALAGIGLTDVERHEVETCVRAALGAARDGPA